MQRDVGRLIALPIANALLVKSLYQRGATAMRRSLEIRQAVAFQHSQDRAAKLRRLVEDLQQTERSLVEEIKAEEHRTRRHDPKDFGYSTLATAMRGRLDNLRVTISRLESDIQSPLAA